MRVLLLNPPGRLPYQRDYYCSKVSKAGYLFHPTDLLMLSGTVAARHDVKVLDALAEGLSIPESLRRIAAFDPEVVVALCGAVSWEEDAAFFARLKEWKPRLRLLVSGDLVLEGPETFPDESAIDALLLDFTTSDILVWIENGEDPPPPHIFCRRDGRWHGRLPERASDTPFTLPLPRHELFPRQHYRFPFLRSRAFATVLTDYGCRYHCRFCVAGNLGYQWRPVVNVLEELDLLAVQGYREIYFNDQTFGLRRERTEELLRAMATKSYGFGWACWSRVDLIDVELLDLMRAAGCHAIMFGAEAADNASLATWGKGFGTEAVVEAMQLCRRAGIRTLATFILGLPGQDRAACLRTIAFACHCGCDFASFNVPVPRQATDLRRQAIKQGWVARDDVVFDQSGLVATMGNGILSAGEIAALRREAVRAFYLRPGYLFNRLAAVRSPVELLSLIRYGLATLR